MLTEKRLGFIPFTLSKRVYRGWVDAAKKQYNMNKIVMAKNPCKAAWNLVSQTYNGKLYCICNTIQWETDYEI